jgi:HK97 family phage major capsid protein
MTDKIHHPRDDLYRAMQGGATSEDGKTLTIRLAPHDQWAEIQSVTEGHFMERFSRTAYRKTMAENPPKILFQHGKDPEIGEKPIATTDEAGEDAISPFARGQLLEGLPELIVDGIRKGVYGASHRFSVVREKWEPNPIGGPHNPDKLPERTISEARLFELGPVTWGAYSSATASLRSITDEMRAPITEPEAPSLDAEAESPHLEPERRDEPVVVAAIQSKEKKPVDITQYRTRDEMSARRRELDAEITRMAELPGVLDTGTQVDWDEKTEERKALDEAIVAWDKRVAFAESIAPKEENRVAYEAPQVLRRPTETDIYDLDAVWSRSRSPEQRAQTLRDNAMRSVEQATFPHPAARPDEARAHIASLLDYKDTSEGELAQRILVTGSPLYGRYFDRIIAGQNLSSEEQRVGALAVGVSATGGAAVPYYFDPTIVPIGAWTSVNPYRQACRVEQIVGSNVWQAVAAGAVTAVRALEAGVAVEAGPGFEAPSITVKKVQSLVTYSIEMSQDRADLASEMARLIQEGKDTEEENSFTIGDGSDPAPFGMMAPHASVNGFWTVIHTAGAGAAIGDTYAVEAALMLRHRMNAAWFMSRPAIRAFQALENSSGQLFGGNYYASVGYPQLNPAGNTGLRLLNYPIWEVPSAPYSAAADIVIAAFGDPKQYVIVDRVGMNVEVIPHIFTGAVPTGQRALYAMWRNSARAFGAVGAACTGGLRLANAS